MVLSAIILSILIFTYSSPIGIHESDVRDMSMCKLDQHADVLASVSNVTTVENPVIYVTCIHHTDGIHHYYNLTIPATDCKPAKKNSVEMIEENVEQLEKDVCPVRERWPSCASTEFNLSVPIPNVIPPVQPSFWHSLTNYATQIIDHFTTISWRIKMQDLLRHDENFEFGFDTATARSKSTRGTDQKSKPNWRVYRHYENYVRGNVKSGQWRMRRSGGGELAFFYQQFYAMLHGITSTASRIFKQTSYALSALVSKAAERVLGRKTTRMAIHYAPVFLAVNACLLAGMAGLYFAIKYFARKRNERQREEYLKASSESQNRAKIGRKQQQRKKKNKNKNKKRSKHTF